MRLADGLLLVVDVLEGVGAATERAIQQAVAEGLAITLLISKVRECATKERVHMDSLYIHPVRIVLLGQY
jgi:translation elongation factor EF-G